MQRDQRRWIPVSCVKAEKGDRQWSVARSEGVDARSGRGFGRARWNWLRQLGCRFGSPPYPSAPRRRFKVGCLGLMSCFRPALGGPLAAACESGSSEGSLGWSVDLSKRFAGGRSVTEGTGPRQCRRKVDVQALEREILAGGCVARNLGGQTCSVIAIKSWLPRLQCDSSATHL
jgi:hypothetical protein